MFSNTVVNVAVTGFVSVGTTMFLDCDISSLPWCFNWDLIIALQKWLVFLCSSMVLDPSFLQGSSGLLGGRSAPWLIPGFPVSLGSWPPTDGGPPLNRPGKDGFLGPIPVSVKQDAQHAHSSCVPELLFSYAIPAVCTYTLQIWVLILLYPFQWTSCSQPVVTGCLQLWEWTDKESRLMWY